jgi:hypothetical protein
MTLNIYGIAYRNTPKGTFGPPQFQRIAAGSSEEAASFFGEDVFIESISNICSDVLIPDSAETAVLKNELEEAKKQVAELNAELSAMKSSPAPESSEIWPS